MLATNKKALIVTALPLEYQAVREHLKNITQAHSSRGVPYESGEFVGRYSEWNTGIVQLVEAGNEEAALATQEAMGVFKPELMLFVGVAGGIKDVALGDVVVATKVYGYEYGVAKRQFETRPDVGRSDDLLVHLASFHAKSDGWLKRLQSPTPEGIRVFVAPIAAGSAVVKSKQSAIARLLKASYSDALAVEMEGSGFLRAAWRESTTRAIVIRGISDLLGNKQRTDHAGWQTSAAKNAAAFAFELLANYGASYPTPLEQPPRQENASDIREIAEHVQGHDPILGNEALEEIGLIGIAALPELKLRLLRCGVNEYIGWQASMRLPRAFGLIGEASVPVLLEVIEKGPWAARVAASKCFRHLRETSAASELGRIIKSRRDPDSVRCAIEALGWLNSWGWAIVIDAETFDQAQYECEKYSFYALTAYLLMLAFLDVEWMLASSVDRIETCLTKSKARGCLSKESYWIAVRSIADDFLPLGTMGLRKWITSEDELLHGAAGYIIQRRRPPYAVGYLLGYAQGGGSAELRQASIFALGEIGTKKACDAVIELLELLIGKTEQQRDLWYACLHALSKMYHHLSDDQYAKYGKRLVMPQISRMNAWYTGMKWVPCVDGMQEFLDSGEEWVRRPAAICLGLMQRQVAEPTLKRYLRHASTPMDKVFILAGLVRSGAGEYCKDLYKSLGEAMQAPRLEYIWKRELVAALSLDPADGLLEAQAWAELLRVDFHECIEEVQEIHPFEERLPT
jgi:nucleoside phosphorylase/HEAT repeat protein